MRSKPDRLVRQSRCEGPPHRYWLVDVWALTRLASGLLNDTLITARLHCVLGSLGAIKAGTLYYPLGDVDSRMAHVSFHDVANVIAHVLANPAKHTDGTGESAEALGVLFSTPDEWWCPPANAQLLSRS